MVAVSALSTKSSRQMADGSRQQLCVKHIAISTRSSRQRRFQLPSAICLLFGTTVALRLYGAEAVHTSRTMAFRIKAFARLTLPVKTCAQFCLHGLCYHGAPSISPDLAARSV